MNNWKTYKLGQVAEFINGRAYANSEFRDSGTPIVRIQNLTGEGKTVYSDLDLPPSKVIENGDLIYAWSATFGPYIWKGPRSIYHYHIWKIEPNEVFTDKHYLFYKLKVISDELKGKGTGSIFTHITKSIIENFETKFPDLKDQKRISSILLSLDNKIECNLQMNQTLEEMAQTIFREWFINFKYPNSTGKLVDGLPKDWKKYNLTELLDTISSTHKFPKGKAIFLNTSDILEGEFLHEDYSDAEGLPGQAKKSIRKGDILFSEIRPANKRYAFVDFEADDYVVSTKLMVLRSKGIAESIVLYFFIRSQEVLDQLQILAESRSGTFPQITYSELAKIEMNIPDEETLKLFTELIQSIFSKIRVNQTENRTLISIRDSILPKLMTGQIDLAS